LIAAGVATVAVVVYGAIRLALVDAAMHAAPTVRVGLVQGNVSIKEKGEVRYFDINLDKYQQLSEDLQDKVDIIVWPETVSQRWVPADAPRLEGKDNPFDDLRSHLVFGGLAFRQRGRAGRPSARGSVTGISGRACRATPPGRAPRYC